MNNAGGDPGVLAVERLAHAGLDAAEFRRQALATVRSMMSFDAAFFATVDPAILLFTGALVEEPLAAATPLFLDNEFGRDDVNKFADLARASDTIGTLDHVTHGDRTTSARYRNVLRPLGLGDELRVALLSGGRCWGVLCLHRQDSSLGFSDRDVALLRRSMPHLGQGLREGIALGFVAAQTPVVDGPGIIILGSDMSVVSVNAQAEHWLSHLDATDWPRHLDLPLAIYAAAARATNETTQDDPGSTTFTRLRRSDGGWLTVHASPLTGTAGHNIAVILDAANATQLSSLALAAQGLTPAQSRVAALVLQGRSTQQIVQELRISSNTVQEHLRAVFDKFGIGSRRELVAVLSGRPPTAAAPETRS